LLLELSILFVSSDIESCVLVAWDPLEAGFFWELLEIFSDALKDIPAGCKGGLVDFLNFSTFFTSENMLKSLSKPLLGLIVVGWETQRDNCLSQISCHH
jgi:hypothetical protein